MDTRSVARTARAHVAENHRAERGLELARERFGEIWRIDRWTWRVPACEGDEVVVVKLKPERCPCADFEETGEACEHLFAAWTVRAQTAPCDGCNRRFRRRELIEVQEDHPTLTWSEGHRVCEECAAATGVL